MSTRECRPFSTCSGPSWAPEGGSLELVDLSEGRLTVRYNEGTNEECPECVPSHEMVQQMMESSLKIHAPDVAELELL